MEMPTKLRILTSHNPPVIIAENDNVNSTTGFLVDLLPHLLREADLTGVPYSFRLWNSSSGGRLQSNGSWSGVMGQLARHDVDFALFPLTLTQQRSQYMDYTPAYFDDGYGILVSKPCSYVPLDEEFGPCADWSQHIDAHGRRCMLKVAVIGF
eukprot:GHRR01035810.1.p1 GENE.GHRR01035810.1~~GHRR01035810.1.p1  ORF type:complete len:153 (+),score=23.46 GHRR01035810.1:171-629(+)